MIIGTDSETLLPSTVSVKVRNNQESLAQPPVHTDIRDFKVTQNCSQTTVPKNIKGAKTATEKSAFTDACFFRGNEALRSNAEVSRTDERLGGGGLHMKCQALCRDSR